MIILHEMTAYLMYVSFKHLKKPKDSVSSLQTVVELTAKIHMRFKICGETETMIHTHVYA